MTTRRPIVGGNWKMNTNLASAVELAEDVVAQCAACLEYCDVAMFPPFPYLQAVGRSLGHHQFLLGAQDVYCESNGAYTGEVSTDMLLDLDVEVVLCGHSERRHVIGESDDLINRKLRAAIDAGLHAVLCVGETMEQREADQTQDVVVGQLMSGLSGVSAEHMAPVVIAYEPVWAIGTGKTATPNDAQLVHQIIRRTLEDMYDVELAEATRIQYGGSVKPENASALFAEADIDGFLVGGASLNAEQFAAIVQATKSAGTATRGESSRERRTK